MRRCSARSCPNQRLGAGGLFRGPAVQGGTDPRPPQERHGAGRSRRHRRVWNLRPGWRTGSGGQAGRAGGVPAEGELSLSPKGGCESRSRRGTRGAGEGPDPLNAPRVGLRPGTPLPAFGSRDHQQPRGRADVTVMGAGDLPPVSPAPHRTKRLHVHFSPAVVSVGSGDGWPVLMDFSIYHPHKDCILTTLLLCRGVCDAGMIIMKGELQPSQAGCTQGGLGPRGERPRPQSTGRPGLGSGTPHPPVFRLPSLEMRGDWG